MGERRNIAGGVGAWSVRRALDGLPRTDPEPDHRGACSRLQTTEAIAHGIKASAGVVTSAAVIMVCVFLCFVGLSMTSLKQVGLGLAIAVLIDATVVRVVLLPAVMTLLGERNRYLPRWLDRLPAVEHGIPAPSPVMASPTHTANAQPDDDDERLLPSAAGLLRSDPSGRIRHLTGRIRASAVPAMLWRRRLSTDPEPGLAVTESAG